MTVTVRVHHREGSHEKREALRKRPGLGCGEKKGSELSKESAEIAHLAHRLRKRALGASSNEREENHGEDEPCEDGLDAPKRKRNHSHG